MTPRSFPQCALVFLLAVMSVQALAENPKLTALPDGRVFPTLMADGMAHQLSLNRVTDNREWLGSIGAELPILQAEMDSWVVQAGVGATTFNRLIKTPGHITVSTIDYKVDFPVDVKYHNVVCRIGFGHVSSHWADDGIEILGNHSIGYVRDYLTLGAALDIAELRSIAYLCGDWNFHYEPFAGPWILQAGLQGGWLDLGTEALQAYGAIDIKLRENLAWGTTQSYQLGIRYAAHGRMGLRLCYTLRTGLEERGQLFDLRTTANLVGIVIEI